MKVTLFHSQRETESTHTGTQAQETKSALKGIGSRRPRLGEIAGGALQLGRMADEIEERPGIIGQRHRRHWQGAPRRWVGIKV